MEIKTNEDEYYPQDRYIKSLINKGREALLDSYPDRCSNEDAFSQDFHRELREFINILNEDIYERRGVVKELSDYLLYKKATGQVTETVIATKILLEINEPTLVLEYLKKNLVKKIIGKEEFNEILRQLNKSNCDMNGRELEVMLFYLKNYPKNIDECSTIIRNDYILKRISLNLEENFICDDVKVRDTYFNKLFEIADSQSIRLKNEVINKLVSYSESDLDIPYEIKLKIDDFVNRYTLSGMFVDNEEEFSNYVNILSKEILLNGKTLSEDILKNIKQLFEMPIDSYTEDHYRLLSFIEDYDQELVMNVRCSILKCANNEFVMNNKFIDFSKLFSVDIISDPIIKHFSKINKNIKNDILDNVDINEKQKKDFTLTVQRAGLNNIKYLSVRNDNIYLPKNFAETFETLYRAGLKDNDVRDFIKNVYDDKSLRTILFDSMTLLKDKGSINVTFYKDFLNFYKGKLEDELIKRIDPDNESLISINEFTTNLKLYNEAYMVFQEYGMESSSEIVNFLNNNIKNISDYLFKNLSKSQFLDKLFNFFSKDRGTIKAPYDHNTILGCFAEFSCNNKLSTNWANKFLTEKLLKKLFIESQNYEPFKGVKFLTYLADSPDLIDNINRLLKSKNEVFRQATFEGIYRNYHYKIKADPFFVPELNFDLFSTHLLVSKNLSLSKYKSVINFLVDTGGIYRIEKAKRIAIKNRIINDFSNAGVPKFKILEVTSIIDKHL